MERRHSVYVVELRRAAGPYFQAHAGRKPRGYLYVGLTGLAPRERFLNHLRGYKAARLVTRFGWRLRPSLYEHLNPMAYEKAKRVEVELANSLRKLGFEVHQN